MKTLFQRLFDLKNENKNDEIEKLVESKNRYELYNYFDHKINEDNTIEMYYFVDGGPCLAQKKCNSIEEVKLFLKNNMQ